MDNLMRKSLICKWVFSVAVVVTLLVGCSISDHMHGHLGRTRLVPTENEKGFYGKELCQTVGYHCVQVKRGDTWEKLFPNKEERQWVMRLNRLNMAIHNRPWIVVPDNLKEITYNHLSPLPLKISTKGEKRLLINLKEHAFAAYNEQGQLVHWGPISAGNEGEGYPTVVGGFKIFRIHGDNCKSGKYPIETNGGAPMPYCMFFHRGWAIHGSTLPGRHASHGCVRLFYEDAKWLNQFFLKKGTPVDVICPSL